MATGKILADIELRIRNLEKVLNDVKKGFASIKVEPKFDPKTASDIKSFVNTINRGAPQIKAAAVTVNELALAVNRLGNGLKPTTAFLQAYAQASRQAAKGAHEAAAASNRLKTIGEDLGKQTAITVRRFGGFLIASRLIYGLAFSFARATGEAIQFEKELAKIAQLQGTTIQGAREVGRFIEDLASKFGASSDALNQSAQILAQAGRNASEVRQILSSLAPASLTATFGDLTKSTDSINALLGQFKIQAKDTTQVLDILNSVSKEFNVSIDELFEGLRRSGSSFAAFAGVVDDNSKSGIKALKEFTALFTSVIDTSRESADVIGTAFRTILPRLQRTRTRDLLKDLGIDVLTDKGQFVGPLEAINRIAQGLAKLKGGAQNPQFTALIEEFGGLRQINRALPLFTEITKQQRALAIANQAQGSIAKDAAIAQETLANALDKIREKYQALVRELVRSGTFERLAEAFIGVAGAAIKMADALTPLLPLLAAMGLIRGGIGVLRFGRSFRSEIFAHTVAPVTARKAKGGLVSTLLTPGELVFSPDAVRREGVSRLDKFNKTGDSSGLKSLAGAQMVPGTGNSDSVKKDLPPGSFVIKKGSVNKALGFKKFAGGGYVQKLIKGGLTRDPSDTRGLGDLINAARAAARAESINASKGFVLSRKLQQLDISPELRNMGSQLIKLGNTTKQINDLFEAIVRQSSNMSTAMTKINQQLRIAQGKSPLVGQGLLKGGGVSGGQLGLLTAINDTLIKTLRKTIESSPKLLPGPKPTFGLLTANTSLGLALNQSAFNPSDIARRARQRSQIISSKVIEAPGPVSVFQQKNQGLLTGEPLKRLPPPPKISGPGVFIAGLLPPPSGPILSQRAFVPPKPPPELPEVIYQSGDPRLRLSATYNQSPPPSRGPITDPRYLLPPPSYYQGRPTRDADVMSYLYEGQGFYEEKLRSRPSPRPRPGSRSLQSLADELAYGPHYGQSSKIPSPINVSSSRFIDRNFPTFGKAINGFERFKPSPNALRGIGIGLGATAAIGGSFIGQQIQDNAGSKGVAAFGGALSGAGAGASLGLIFGPAGAIVGGFTGALASATSALFDFEKRVADKDFTKASEGLSKILEDKNISLSAANQPITDTLKAARDKSLSFGFLERAGLGARSITDKVLGTSFVRNKIEERRREIQPDLRDQANALSVRLAQSFAKDEQIRSAVKLDKEGNLVNPEQVSELIRSKIKNPQAALLTSQLPGLLKTDEAKKFAAAQLQTNALVDILKAENIQKAFADLQQSVVSTKDIFEQISKSLDIVGENLIDFGIGAKSLLDAANLQPTVSLGRVRDIFSGSLRGVSLKDFDSATSAIGKRFGLQGNEGFNRVTSFARLSAQISNQIGPGLLRAAQDPENSNKTISEFLSNSFDKLPEEQRAFLGGVIRNLGDFGNKTVGGISEVEIAELSKKFEDALKDSPEILSKVSKLWGDFNKEMEQIFNERTRIEVENLQRGVAIQGLKSEQIDVRRRILGQQPASIAEQAGRVAGDVFGLTGIRTRDPAVLKQEAQKLLEGGITPEESTQFAGLIKALELLASDTRILDATLEKNNELQKAKESSKSFLDRILSGGPQAINEVNREIIAGARLRRGESLESVGLAEGLKGINTLRQAAGALSPDQLKAFNLGTLTDVENNLDASLYGKTQNILPGRFGDALRANILNKRATEGLAGQAEQAIGTRIGAQEALIGISREKLGELEEFRKKFSEDFTKDIQKAFSGEAITQFAQSVADLKTVFSEKSSLELTGNFNLAVTFQGAEGVLNGIQEDLKGFFEKLLNDRVSEALKLGLANQVNTA